MDATPLLDVPGVAVDDPADLREHLDSRTELGREYLALPAGYHGLERGTVVVGDVVVRGFPSVPRVLHLATGVPQFFDDSPVFVEEKLNGYNVRIVDVDGRHPSAPETPSPAVDGPVAFTRGGYLCPYTTDRARALLDLTAFFADHPDLMLCGEFIGPENPYTTHDYDDVDSHDIRVFDIRNRLTGKPLSVERRRELCEQYGFPQPTLFGRYALDIVADRVHDVVADLSARDREGVVMKSADGASLLKYTTQRQHCAELAYAFEHPFERGQDFLFSRVLREAFQAYERDAGDEQRLRERAHALGEAILLPFVETIETAAAGEPIGDAHTVRGDPDVIDALLAHVDSLGIELQVVSEARIDGDAVVEFRKVSVSTCDRLDHYLAGGTVDE